MTLWLILLLVWIVGIPAAVLVAAALGPLLYRRFAFRAGAARPAVAVQPVTPLSCQGAVRLRFGGRPRPVGAVKQVMGRHRATRRPL